MISSMRDARKQGVLHTTTRGFRDACSPHCDRSCAGAARLSTGWIVRSNAFPASTQGIG